MLFRSDDEHDISGRCDRHGASGFIGFYSTIASSSLAGAVDLLRANRRLEDGQILDREKIEHYLLNSEAGRRIVRRYFPLSWLKWEDNQPRLFEGEYRPLECSHCGMGLLKSGMGVIAFFNHEKTDLYRDVEEVVIASSIEQTTDKQRCATRIEDIKWMCQLTCDTQTRKKAALAGLYDISLNYGISDLILPERYVETLGGLVSEICDGALIFSSKATEKLLYLMSAVAQMTVRHSGYEYAPDEGRPE